MGRKERRKKGWGMIERGRTLKLKAEGSSLGSNGGF